MKLSDIIKNDAEYMAYVTVEINSRLGTVDIQDNLGLQESIFLQGSDGEEFISECEALQDNPECADFYLDDIAKHVAKQYVDCIWN
jgi:hypothetical protein